MILLICIVAGLLVVLVSCLAGIAIGAGSGFQHALDTMRSIARRSGPIEREIILRLADYMEERKQNQKEQE